MPIRISWAGRRYARTLRLLAPALLLAVGEARADVFEVNSVADNPDLSPGNGVCDIGLGLGICTLRAAIQEANALPNVARDRDVIEFDINPPGVQTIQPTLAALPAITEAVLIDGTTQGGSSVNSHPLAFNAVVAIEIDGSLLGPGVGTGLGVDSPDVEIKGVAIRNFGTGVVFDFLFPSDGRGRLEGCVIEDNAGDGVQILSNRNVIGGALPRDANLISGSGGNGISIDPGVDNVVNGNVVGTDPSGTAAHENGAAGNLFTAGIADFGTGTVIVRNLVSGQSQVPGILAGGIGGRIQSNRVGTDANGTGVIGNFEGIRVQGPAYQIGGVQQPHGNVVGGNEQVGILLRSDSNRVQGNFIGTDRFGTADVGNIGPGIEANGDDNELGGDAANLGNVIRNNDSGGIVVDAFQAFAAQRNRMTSNLMSGNGDVFFPSISLMALGYVIPNDVGDPDEGPNRLQNFPVLDSAVRDVGTTHVEGDFDSSAGVFSLQVFASRVCGPRGFGEGEQLLGTCPVTLPGDEHFTCDLPVGAIGSIFTAIATDAEGNSSAWSPCLAVAGEVAADLGVQKEVVGGDLHRPDEPIVYQITVTNPGPLAAINTVVEDTLPPGLDFVSASPPAPSVVGQTVTWSLGTLATNSTTMLQLTADVDAAFLTPDGVCASYQNEFVNAVSVTSDQLDLNAENDTAAAPVTVRTGSDLSIALEPEVQSVDAGEDAFMTVSVRNEGPEAASAVIASGTAEGVDCASAVPAFDSCDASGSWTWLVGDLADGAAATLDFTVVPVPAIGDAAELEASVTPVGDPTCDDILATALIGVGGTADLEVTGLRPTISDLVLRVDLRNNGPSPIDGFSVNATALPTGFPGNVTEMFSRVSQPLVAGESTFFTFDILSAADSVTVTVAPLNNVLQVSEYEIFDPVPGNNSGSGMNFYGACGLGNLELVLLAPIGIWLARRRRHWR